jgi:hypothetical protein
MRHAAVLIVLLERSSADAGAMAVECGNDTRDKPPDRAVMLGEAVMGFETCREI